MNIEFIAGTRDILKTVLPPFDDRVCLFLDDLSRNLRKDEEAKQYPDVQTFAFWCRKANILKIKQDFESNSNHMRIGKGMIFHIAPSNVPVNAGFTYVFGLLAGNTNVVRISQKKHPQVLCLCRVLNQMFEDAQYKQILDMTSFISYERDQLITDTYSKECAMRIIWGGDHTIEEIRKSPLSPRSTEITFADRYSFGVMDGSVLDQYDERKMNQLAESFYNDTYLMDQNACSTPHIIFWINATDVSKSRFWNAVHQVAQKYDLAGQKASDKYTKLCEMAASHKEIQSIDRFDNSLYVIDLDRSQMKKGSAGLFRGLYGMFFQTDIDSFDQIFELLDERAQTCAVCGLSEEDVRKKICEIQCLGVDRVVLFGKTLDIGLTWDGYELIRSLSRCIG